LQSIPVDGQECSRIACPSIGHHEANINILGGFLQFLEKIVGHQVQSDGAILHPELAGKLVAEIL
jgi:hypothetical protein